MQTRIRIRNEVLQRLCCPICHSKLELVSDCLKCLNPQCKASFPIVDGIPSLINESSSLFYIEDFVHHRSTTYQPISRRGLLGKIEQLARKLLPKITHNIKARQIFLKFAEHLLEQNENPMVLILGGSIVGQGLESILSLSSIQFVETDVSFGPRTVLVCDAHDIPFEDGTLDGVIVQGVLEHVVAPDRCVEEIHRVLKDEGLVYAETPFMQQVHWGKYDFTRFTYLGHRRLFRKFSEVCSGAVAGPGMVLAWSYQYFFLSFTKAKLARKLITAFAMLSSFWVKYFDYILIDKPGTLDAASSYYLIARKSNQVLSDRELISLYNGGWE